MCSGIFVEGNTYILNKQLWLFTFDNRFNLYHKLNDINTFDYSWFIIYYNKYNLSYQVAYELYKNSELYGNNFQTKLGWQGLADCMIEHSFERIIFNVCKLFPLKIK